MSETHPEPMRANNPETAGEVTDQQKLDLFESATALLHDRVLALQPESKYIKDATSRHLRKNLAMLIEEICLAGGGNGTEQCESFFKELEGVLDNSDGLAPLHLSSKFANLITSKLYPLLIRRMERLEDEKGMEMYSADFKGDTKTFASGGAVGFIGMSDKEMPAWYRDLERRNSYQKLVEQSITDPEADALLKRTHQKAIAQLRGEEPLDEEKH